MWTFAREELGNGRILRFLLNRGPYQLLYSQVLEHWREDPEFCAFFTKLLAQQVPFGAFRWETPPLSLALVDRPFEFVVLDAPGLARRPDIETFAEFFETAVANTEVVSFPSLRKDALLVVPCPRGPVTAYGHIGAFVREAPLHQQQALWQMVGSRLSERLSVLPVWLSTAGAGVSWLHVRLDTVPKYYAYKPYKSFER